MFDVSALTIDPSSHTVAEIFIMLYMPALLAFWVAVIGWGILERLDCMKRWKAQPDPPLPFHLYRQSVFLSVFNMHVVFPLCLVPFALMWKHGRRAVFCSFLPDMLCSKVAPHPVEFSWTDELFMFTVTSFFGDLMFYLMHRGLHVNKWLYKKVHLTHHNIHAPHILSSMYMSVWEVIFVVVPSMYLPSFLFPNHFWSGVLFSSSFVFNAATIHAGLDVDPFGFIKSHDDHHLRVRGNYSMLGWDVVFNTKIPAPPSAFSKLISYVTGASSAKSVKAA